MKNVTLLIAFLYALTIVAQNDNRVRFEVASIKPTAEGGVDSRGLGIVRALPGGRISAQKAQLRYLIQNAYRMRPFQVLGGPDWINSAHFDIEAKAADGNAGAPELWGMLQGLLEERFKLKVRRETQELPVYELGIAKNGLKLAPPRQGSCLERNAAGPAGSELTAPPPRGSGQPFVAPCGAIIAGGGTAGMRMDGGKVVMMELARILTNMLARPVIDKTGVTETFDVHLQFSFDQALAGFASDPGRPAFASDPAGPSIFTALQEQLGLKLESTKGPVEVIFIEHIEKPSVN